MSSTLQLSPVLQSIRPLVSIVIPTWNRAQELMDTVDDFRRQSLSDFELFIIDDQSPDNTEQIGQELAASDQRFHYYRLPEKGYIYGGMNEGIRRSSGRYIYIAHDHDRYLPELLERMVAVFEQHCSIVYTFCGAELWNHDYSHHLTTNFHALEPITDGGRWRNVLLSHYHCPVPAQSMIRRVALEQVGLFDPKFGASTDVEMWIRLCEIGDVGYVNEPLLHIRGRDIDHHYSYNWNIINEVVQIHQNYLAKRSFDWQYLQQFIGFYRQYDWVALRMYLSAHKRRRTDAVKAGRTYLRKHGFFLSKLAAYLL